MRCELCGNEIIKTMHIYTIYQPLEKETLKLDVCGRCYLLTDILRKLGEISNKLNDKPIDYMIPIGGNDGKLR